MNNNKLMHLKLPTILSIVFLMSILFIPFTISIEPTMQYTKIYLNPFYNTGMIQNAWYNYTVNINSPDGMSNIKSAIVTLDAWINPTRTFSAKINDIYCMNNYTVSTTYASAGRSVITFDCSNAVKMNQINRISFMVTGGNIGSSTAFIELTYENRPKGDIEVSGTEYSPNDQATMFVQLKNSQGLPVQNGSCYIDIWYPLNQSNIHPYTIQDAPMLEALGDDGMYYYDMIVPDILGVYMLSAKCSYSYNWIWIYPESEQIYYPIPTRITGTWTNNSQSLNDKSDGVYERCDATAGILCQSTYRFNITQYGNISNITTINLYFAGQGDTNGKIVTFAYWNGSTYVNLSNTWTITTSGASTTQVGAVDQFVSNSIPSSAIINGTVIIRYTGQTGLARYYNNWLTLALLSSSGTIQDIKGSSEMHVTDIVNATITEISNITLIVDTQDIVYNVWNYTNRSLTYYENYTIPQQDLTNYSRIRDNQYNYTSRFDYIDSKLTNISFEINNIFINITSELQNIITYIFSIPYNVWNYNTRNLTYYEHVDMTNYTRIDDTIYAINTSISNELNNYYLNISTILSYLPNNTAITVWEYTNRSLTYYEINNITPSDVWSFINRTLTYYDVNNITSDDIWMYNNRTLTYYPSQSDLTNYTRITDDVWNYTGRYTHGVILS